MALNTGEMTSSYSVNSMMQSSGHTRLTFSKEKLYPLLSRLSSIS